MKNKNIFWGIIFILAALAVIAFQFGSLNTIQPLNIVIGILLVALIISSLVHRNFFGVFFPLALLYFTFQKVLGLKEVDPWLLILAAVLTSIGFSIIFGNKQGSHKSSSSCDNFSRVETGSSESLDDNNPYAKVSFGESVKYLHANALQSGSFASYFGEMQVYFDQVTLSPDGAKVVLDCSFASIKLYIPRSWRVVDDMHVSLGEFKNAKRMEVLDENAPKLTVTGNVQFGSIEIYYI